MENVQEKALRLLSRKNTSKEQLREAIANLLNVPYISHKAKTVDEAIFTKCKTVFFDFYCGLVGVEYFWGSCDSRYLKQLIKKIQFVQKDSAKQTVDNDFRFVLTHLPKWYIENGLSISLINSKFNDIIASIKASVSQKEEDVIKKTGVSESYINKIKSDLK